MSANFDVPINNMVESNEPPDSDSTLMSLITQIRFLSVHKIAGKDIEFDINQIEKFIEGWKAFEDERKKFFILKNLEREIQKILFERKINTDKMPYLKLKEYLIELYGIPNVSITNHFSLKQLPNESFEEFIKKMERREAK